MQHFLCRRQMEFRKADIFKAVYIYLSLYSRRARGLTRQCCLHSAPRMFDKQ